MRICCFAESHCTVDVWPVMASSSAISCCTNPVFSAICLRHERRCNQAVCSVYSRERNSTKSTKVADRLLPILQCISSLPPSPPSANERRASHANAHAVSKHAVMSSSFSSLSANDKRRRRFGTRTFSGFATMEITCVTPIWHKTSWRCWSSSYYKTCSTFNCKKGCN